MKLNFAIVVGKLTWNSFWPEVEKEVKKLQVELEGINFSIQPSTVFQFLLCLIIYNSSHQFLSILPLTFSFPQVFVEQRIEHSTELIHITNRIFLLAYWHLKRSSPFHSIVWKEHLIWQFLWHRSWNAICRRNEKKANESMKFKLSNCVCKAKICKCNLKSCLYLVSWSRKPLSEFRLVIEILCAKSNHQN